MASLLIRHIDDQLMRELERRAEAEHRSVEQLVHSVLLGAMRTPLQGRPLDLITGHTGRPEPMRREEIVGEDELG